jgi:hypothetical protein
VIIYLASALKKKEKLVGTLKTVVFTGFSGKIGFQI